MHVQQTAAAKQQESIHFVTCDDYVTMTDGTGIVHIAPAFGEDDAVSDVSMIFHSYSS